MRRTPVSPTTRGPAGMCTTGTRTCPWAEWSRRSSASVPHCTWPVGACVGSGVVRPRTATAWSSTCPATDGSATARLPAPTGTLFVAIAPVAASRPERRAHPASSRRLVGLPPRSGPPLALVHRLHASDRDLMDLVDEVAGQRLRVGHLVEPGVSIADQRRHRVDR